MSDWMTAEIQAAFNPSCDATNCNFTCLNTEMVPHDGGSAWDGKVACTQPTAFSNVWDGFDIAFAGCAHLPDCPDFNADHFNSLIASISCSGGSCAVVCNDNKHPSTDTIDCSNYNEAVACSELSCDVFILLGDVFYNSLIQALSADSMVMPCDSLADSCELTCVDDNLIPFPFSRITCDMVVPEPADKALGCAVTGCGDPSNWDYGAGFSDVNVTCHGLTGICDLTCVSTPDRPFPYPVTQVECTTHVLTPSAGSNITCESTKCGNPDGWNFGAEYSAMTKSCDLKNNGNMDCIVTCSIGNDAGFVIDADGNSFNTVVCQDDGLSRILLPSAGSISLLCAETPCGKLSTNVNIDPAVFAICDATGCTFACPGGTMPSYAGLTCGNNGYDHVDGSDINPINCVATQDTPCGDVSSIFAYNPAEVNLNCASFNSIHQNSAMHCGPTCSDPTKILITDSTLTCENKAFTNTDLNILCKSTTCGDVAVKFTIAAGVSHTCDTNTGICAFSCDNSGELPLVTQVTCNQQTNNFDDITLWPNNTNPLLNLGYEQCKLAIEYIFNFFP